jgi:hypothetical protein
MPPPPTPPSVPPPSPLEERRLLAETVRDTYQMLELVNVNAHILLPGDAITDWTRAWEALPPGSASEAFAEIISDLISAQPQVITDQHLEGERLTKESGALKRNFIRRLRDEAMRYLRPTKSKEISLSLVTPSERKLGLEVLGEYFDAAATFVKSVSPTAGAAVEFLSYTKQLCKAAAKWL